MYAFGGIVSGIARCMAFIDLDLTYKHYLKTR